MVGGGRQKWEQSYLTCRTMWRSSCWVLPCWVLPFHALRPGGGGFENWIKIIKLVFLKNLAMWFMQTSQIHVKWFKLRILRNCFFKCNHANDLVTVPPPFFWEYVITNFDQNTSARFWLLGLEGCPWKMADGLNYAFIFHRIETGWQ